MHVAKKSRGRPRGQGPYGVLRAEIAQMRPGATTTITLDRVTDKGRRNPGVAISNVCRLAAQDIGDAKFTILSLAGGVYVRREQ